MTQAEKIDSKNGWVPFTPTWTNLKAKTVFDPPYGSYYWSKWHIVTWVSEYVQDGKTVSVRFKYKRLGLIQSVSFWLKQALQKGDDDNR